MWKLYIYRGMLFILSLVVVVMFWDVPWVAFILLSLLLIQANMTFKWRLLKTSLLCALLGPLAEIIAIAGGAWKYSIHQLAGVPYWLAPLWGIAALFFIGLAELIKELPEPKEK